MDELMMVCSAALQALRKRAAEENLVVVVSANVESELNRPCRQRRPRSGWK
jgi:hypothetical protein